MIIVVQKEHECKTNAKGNLKTHYQLTAKVLIRGDLDQSFLWGLSFMWLLQQTATVNYIVEIHYLNVAK